MALLNASLLTYLVLLLSFFHVSFASTIIVRQSTTASTTTGSIDCASYSRIANLTTIGSNSTYRAAWLRSAPMGTFKAASIVDKDSLKLMALQMDSQLNGECGNLTTIAFQAAATNFTQGTVLGLPIKVAVGVAVDSFAMPFIWGISSVLLGGLWACI